MKTAISNLKDKFLTGKCPTGEDFADVFDSFVHKDNLPTDNIEIHTDSMPAASAGNEGKIYLYAGGLDNAGTFYAGNKYICRSYDGGFRWESLNGYVIASDGISGGGGTSLPDGTIVVPLKTTTIGSVTYYAGTPLIVQNGGWYSWRGDTAKAAVIWDLPVASADNVGMTFLVLNTNDTPYKRGFYTSYKTSDGQYSWRKVGLVSEENFTTAEKEKLASIGSGEGGVGDLSYLETQLNSEIERAKGAENDLQLSLNTEISRATTAEEVLRSSINTISAAMPSISDMDISETDSLGNMAASGTYIVTDGTKKGFMIFDNMGNNAQRQTLYMENVLKYRTRDAAGWGEWSILADFSNALAQVATTGSYNDLKNRPALSSVATTGSYDSLSDKPFQGNITLAAADNLYQSYQNGAYTVTDGGLTPGILFFSTSGMGGLMQYLLQDGTIKSRTGSYTGSSPSWNEWQTVDFGFSDYNDLLNKPIQLIESESYLDNLNYSNTSGIYVCKTSSSATLYLSTTTSSSTYIQIKMGLFGIAYRQSYATDALGNKEWTTFVHYPWDWDNTNNSAYPSDLNKFTEEGLYFVKGTNDKATNLPVTNTGETINVAFTLLVSVSKPITLENGTERAIVGQQLTLANRIGSENKQYLRHAIVDTINGETTYTWGVWREVVTQTMLGSGGICTDAEIDAAIDNGIYSGVASESGILPQYSTFTVVVVNNYAATAAASATGIQSDWRQVTQTFIALPLSTNGEITEGATYMRTGIGGSTITWGELKQVGGEEPTLYIAEPQTEQVWDLKNHPNWGCPVSMDIHSTVVYIKLDETINHPYQKEYHFILTGVSSGTVAFHIDTEKEFEFKKLVRSSNNNFPNVSTDLQDTGLGMYTVAPATLKVYFTGNKYYVYFDY